MVSLRPDTRRSSAPTTDAPKLRPTNAGRIGLPKAPAGTVYRGHEGMWSWVLHRVTGVSIFFFLLVHIMDQALVRVSPEAYDGVIATYKNPIMGLGELVLVGAIAFHAFNGLRIIAVDFFAVGTKYHRLMFYGVLGLWTAIMIPFTIKQLSVIAVELTEIGFL